MCLLYIMQKDPTIIIVKPCAKTKKSKKIQKVKETDYIIPNFCQYKLFNNTNYPVSFLKTICKNYKLKVSGNKLVYGTRY